MNPATSSWLNIWSSFHNSMRGLWEYLAVAFSSLVMALERKFPIISARRGVSTGWVIVIVVLVMGAGVVAFYLIISPSIVTTTTTVYP